MIAWTLWPKTLNGQASQMLLRKFLSLGVVVVALGEFEVGHIWGWFWFWLGLICIVRHSTGRTGIDAAWPEVLLHLGRLEMAESYR